MPDAKELGSPTELAGARNMAHAGAQLLYRAAAANLAPLPGAEHSNLGWNATTRCFQTHGLGDCGLSVTLALHPFELAFDGKSLALDGQSSGAAIAWLDQQLDGRELRPASAIKIPYDLPGAVTDMTTFTAAKGLHNLAAWFDLAAMALDDFAARHSRLTPGPSPVRCWPHHFDIATYVSLESGDAETARGIGVGMSPGDGSYDQPYFYVNPWPYPDPARLPDPVAPGHWHTDGFVGSIARGVDILTLPDVAAGTQAFLTDSFRTCCKTLGL